jgi:SAM-dependent methyltransferase
VLDVGTGDGALFRLAGDAIAGGVGLDPTLDRPVTLGNAVLLPGHFPGPDFADGRFDAITLLAVFEHIPAAEQARFAGHCADHLVSGGLVIITVPSPRVDRILGVLLRLRLVDGMSLEEHFGFDPQTSRAYSRPPPGNWCATSGSSSGSTTCSYSGAPAPPAHDRHLRRAFAQHATGRVARRLAG